MATQPQVESDMQQHEVLPEPATGSQLTAPNLSVEVNGGTFVYRRYGNTKRDTPPLLCLQHFRGNLDQWDPASCDRIAQDRDRCRTPWRQWRATRSPSSARLV